MKPGDIVQTFKRDPRNTGFRVSAGQVKLIKPIGTVPNYWLVEHPRDGMIKIFVYQEDQDGL